LFQVFSALHISIHNLFKPSFHQGFLFLHFLLERIPPINIVLELLLESTNNQQQLWKKIGKIGVTENRKSIIPMEVIDDDGNVSSQLTEVLNKWKSAYSNLLNQQY
jgi:hypothetical protein